MLAEGMGIRATARVVGVHRDTVLRILKFAGGRCQRLLENKLQNVKAESVQVDEIWTTVRRRLKAHQKVDPELDKSQEGDFYVFMGVSKETKLLFTPLVGKRTELSTELFSKALAGFIEGRVQVTSDGYRPYKDHITQAFGNRVDFAQYYKEFNTLKNEVVPPPVIGRDGVLRQMIKAERPKSLFVVRSGTPEPSKISTCHIERCNLTLRTMNKRFNRETACFSKTVEYLNYSVFLFAAYYNFCKLHSSLDKKTTPAMAQGLAQAQWGINELVKYQ